LDEFPCLPEDFALGELRWGERDLHLVDTTSEGGTTSDDGFVHVANVWDFDYFCKDYFSKTYDQ
jgi:hypothetical protein